MSEDDKPIFPRLPQNEEERKKILWETQSKLEKEETAFSNYEESICPNCGFKSFGQGKFCRRCGSRVNLKDFDAPIPVYGPPPMGFNNTEADEIHVTAYGPPPMTFENEKNIVLPVYGPPPIEFENRQKNPQPAVLVYGPPPMPIKDGVPKNNKLLIFAALLLFGLIFFGAVMAVIIYFLFLR